MHFCGSLSCTISLYAFAAPWAATSGVFNTPGNMDVHPYPCLAQEAVARTCYIYIYRNGKRVGAWANCARGMARSPVPNDVSGDTAVSLGYSALPHGGGHGVGAPILWSNQHGTAAGTAARVGRKYFHFHSMDWTREREIASRIMAPPATASNAVQNVVQCQSQALYAQASMARKNGGAFQVCMDRRWCWISLQKNLTHLSEIADLWYAFLIISLEKRAFGTLLIHIHVYLIYVLLQKGLGVRWGIIRFRILLWEADLWTALFGQRVWTFGVEILSSHFSDLSFCSLSYCQTAMAKS